MFICSDCGFESKKWAGKCISCGVFGTIKEFRESKTTKVFAKNTRNNEIKNLNDNDKDNLKIKLTTKIAEFDRALSGGITQGSVTLISGAPGIGKSTLLIQIAECLSQTQNTLYVSGEESLNQIGNRAKRLNLKNDRKNKIFQQHMCRGCY